MYLLYSVVIVAFFAVMSPSLLYQAVRYRKYIGSLSQRFGYLPISFNLDAEESIWVHAVSVGEVLAARPVLAGLRERYPDLRLFLSTTTMSMPLSSIAARMMLRPMRPNPLIPTLMAIYVSSELR